MRIKNTIFIIALSASTLASAYDFKSGDLYFNVIDPGRCSVVAPREGSLYAGDIVIPEDVADGDNHYMVTSIGEMAFAGSEGLTGVEIPATVTDIGSGAFRGCIGLESLDFSATSALLGNYVMEDCTGLKRVILPKGDLVLGRYLFAGCESLETVVYGSDTRIMQIGDYAFFGNRSLKEFKAGAYLGYIGRGSFNGCSSLPEFNFEGAREIGDAAFKDCTMLKEVDLPAGCRLEGEGVFAGCRSLYYAALPEGMEEIPANTFSGCTSLRSVLIPEGVRAIGLRCFNDCKALDDCEFPVSLERIGDYAFSGCVGFEKVNITGGISQLGEGCYEGCTGIREASVWGNVKRIPNRMFYGCSGLTDLEIVYNVEEIGEMAFYGCSSLAGIYLDDMVPPVVSIRSFEPDAYGRACLFVPEGSETVYSHTPIWMDFRKMTATSEFLTHVGVEEVEAACEKIFAVEGNILEVMVDEARVEVNSADGRTLVKGRYAAGDRIELPSVEVLIVRDLISGTALRVLSR